MINHSSRVTIFGVFERYGDSESLFYWTVLKSHLLRMSRNFRLKADMKYCNKSVNHV